MVEIRSATGCLPLSFLRLYVSIVFHVEQLQVFGGQQVTFFLLLYAFFVASCYTL